MAHLSDDEHDREIDIESDEDRQGGAQGGGMGGGPMGGAQGQNGEIYQDKRAHHNALERKRRDHIKESFSGLRDAIPMMQGDKSSRANILKKASDYIVQVTKKNEEGEADLRHMRRQKDHMREQINAIKESFANGETKSAAEILEAKGLNVDAESLLREGPSSSSVSASYDPAYEAGSGSDDSDGSASGVTLVQHAASASSSSLGPSGYAASTNSTPARNILPGQSILIGAYSSSGGNSVTGIEQPSKKRSRME